MITDLLNEILQITVTKSCVPYIVGLMKTIFCAIILRKLDKLYLWNSFTPRPFDRTNTAFQIDTPVHYAWLNVPIKMRNDLYFSG